MRTQLKQVFSGSFCKHIQQIIDTDGRTHDVRFVRIVPQAHHRIITTEDGFKLALNPHNGIAYLIKGRKY